MSTMRQKSSVSKTVQKTVNTAEHDRSTGSAGVALTPPTYGLDLLDRRQLDGAPPIPLVQTKLTIGAPNDRYEREADRVAAQFVQYLHAPENLPPRQDQLIQRQALGEKEEDLQMKPLLQLKGNEGRMAAPPAVESAIQRLRGRGQPLAAQVRYPMEQAFGADFSGVKVHTDTQSDLLNRSIQAKAFTTGHDLFFRQGAYQPGSRAGQELLVHELTHVVQQDMAHREDITPSGGGLIQRTLAIEPPNGYLAKFLTESLQTLLTNTRVTVKVNENNGMVSLTGDNPTPDEVERSHGYRLLSRIISSPKHIKLISDGNSKYQKATTKALDPEGASKPGTGSDVEMFIDPDVLEKSIVKNLSTSEIIVEDTPGAVVVGHELIHADRAQRGVRATGPGSGFVEYEVKGKLKGTDTRASWSGRAEEILTVGIEKHLVPARFGQQDITENDLRAQLGLNPVVAYESDTQGFFSTYMQRSEKGAKTVNLYNQQLTKLYQAMDAPYPKTLEPPDRLWSYIESLRKSWNQMDVFTQDVVRHKTIIALDEYVMRVERRRPPQAQLGGQYGFKGL